MSSVREFLIQTYVQTLIAELTILCSVIGVMTILILFALDLTAALRSLLRRRK